VLVVSAVVFVINFINMHVKALISLKISTRKGWKTWTLVYTWNHLKIYWCFSDCGLLCLSNLLQTCVVSVYPHYDEQPVRSTLCL